MKRSILTLALILAVAVSAVAATPMAAGKTSSGKVTAIDGIKVTITVEGDRPDWLKKNAFAKFKIGTGKVVEVSAPEAAPITFVVSIKKASAMKVDEVVTFEKGLAVAGC